MFESSIYTYFNIKTVVLIKRCCIKRVQHLFCDFVYIQINEVIMVGNHYIKDIQPAKKGRDVYMNNYKVIHRKSIADFRILIPVD